MDLSTRELERLLSDIQSQPNWRREADKGCAYYDGNQLSPEMVAVLKKRGQPLLVNNLIAPVIDSVLGMEAKTRQGVRVRADNDDGLLVAEALNEELNEMSRMTKSDRAIGDAFASQTKAGLGWAEFNPASDPFGYPYRCNAVHRNEMFWDFKSVLPNLEDCRWLLRRRWIDEDELIAFWPQYKELIKHAAAGWSNFANDIDTYHNNHLSEMYSEYQHYSFDEEQLFDTERRRVHVHEVYYRVFERGLVMFAPGGRAVRFDKNNRLHVAMAQSDQVQVKSMPYKRMHLAWYIGPHKVWAGPSPHPHNNFPYIPFWGYREDTTRVPYGLIRRMISPQDEVNFRRSKLTYLLNAKLIIKDKDAVAMSDEDLLTEINAADGIVTLNENRKNVESKGFWVEESTNIAAQQFNIMQEAKQQIQDCAGVFNAMMGQDSNATSGIAINGLIEQGATTLAELFDNYRFAKNSLYELMLAYKIQEIGSQEKQVLINVNEPDKTKNIMLNQRVRDDQGREVITNDVSRTKAQVVLDDIVNTPGYRAQLTQRMMELVQTLPPNLQVAVFDLVVSSTDIPQKDEFLKRIRKATGQGINPEELTPEEQAQIKRDMEEASMAKQLQLREMQGKIANLEADAQKKMVDVAKTQSDINSTAVNDELTEAQTLKILGELKQITQNLETSMVQQTGQFALGRNPQPIRQLM